MGKVEKLADLARSKGLDVVFLKFNGDMNHLCMVYHDRIKAGIMPIEEYCRDKKDYDLLMNAWMDKGIVCSPEYKDFNSMLSGELKRLKNVR